MNASIIGVLEEEEKEFDEKLMRSCGPHYALFTVRSIVKQLEERIQVGEEEEEETMSIVREREEQETIWKMEPPSLVHTSSSSSEGSVEELGEDLDSDSDDQCVRTPEVHAVSLPSTRSVHPPFNKSPRQQKTAPQPQPTPSQLKVQSVLAHYRAHLAQIERIARLEMLEEIGAMHPDPNAVLGRVMGQSGGARKERQPSKLREMWVPCLELPTEEEGEEGEWRRLEEEMREWAEDADGEIEDGEAPARRVILEGSALSTSSSSSNLSNSSGSSSDSSSSLEFISSLAPSTSSNPPNSPSRRRCVAIRSTDSWEEGVVLDVRRRVNPSAAPLTSTANKLRSRSSTSATPTHAHKFINPTNVQVQVNMVKTGVADDDAFFIDPPVEDMDLSMDEDEDEERRTIWERERERCVRRPFQVWNA